MTPQTSWLYGIYSKLISPQAIPILANKIFTPGVRVRRTLGGLLAHVLVVDDVFSPNYSRFGLGTTSKTEDPVWYALLVVRRVRGVVIGSRMTIVDGLCP